ncbi:hypothetical protein RD792_001480 [Penstemon davidsonii]|uniref:Protein LURP-one-related 17 n=1 Tax=Penstemon davidsonii TaxID=160366 RepID=A0ABR0DNJ1_9LAMI|nr:hypothetical protein RD792_001480 [Penstemon davidsonii]
MVLFLKSISKTVHHYHEDEEERKDHNKNHDSTEEKTTISNNNVNYSLTVWRKSLLFSCNGFTVIGAEGSLVYRVDNYTGPRDHIILMDGSGNPIFTISRHKRLRILNNYWLIYEGEVDKCCKKGRNYSVKKPIFCVRKKLNIMGRSSTKLSVNAYVYDKMLDRRKRYRHTYMIEGSYAHRSCKILDESKSVVAEIRRKEATTSGLGGVSFGLDVFHLIVCKLGLDSRFAMAIVLLLDQMFS